MRQFGLEQTIPRGSDVDFDQHKITLRGKEGVNWIQKHERWIQMWNSRHQRIPHGMPITTQMGHNHPYMQWYKMVTRRWMTPFGAMTDVVADMTVDLSRMCTTDGQRRQCHSILNVLDESERLESSVPFNMVPPSDIPRPTEAETVEDMTTGRCRRTRHKRRSVTTESGAGPSNVDCGQQGTDFMSTHMPPYVGGTNPDLGTAAAYVSQMDERITTQYAHDGSAPFMHDFFHEYPQSPLFSPPTGYTQSTVFSTSMQSPYYSEFGVHASTPSSAHVEEVSAGQQAANVWNFMEGNSTMDSSAINLPLLQIGLPQQPNRAQPSRAAHGAGVRCGTGGCIIGQMGKQWHPRRQCDNDEDDSD